MLIDSVFWRGMVCAAYIRLSRSASPIRLRWRIPSESRFQIVPRAAKKSPQKPSRKTPARASGELRLLEKILARLDELQPRVQKIPVEELARGDATMTFLDIDSLSFITTESEDKKFELMFVHRDGRRYFANGSLAHFEDQLEDNPHWLRTSQKYLINLNRIQRSRINRARDLVVDGYEGWISNAVSPNSGVTKYLDRFKERFITNV